MGSDAAADQHHPPDLFVAEFEDVRRQQLIGNYDPVFQFLPGPGGLQVKIVKQAQGQVPDIIGFFTDVMILNLLKTVDIIGRRCHNRRSR